MKNILNLEEVFNSCTRDGFIINQHFIPLGRVKILFSQGLDNYEEAQKSKNNSKWHIIYNLYYNALHYFAIALTMLDKIKILNHQCLFAYLCSKHSELDLEWELLEKIRLKRNDLHYYGTQITQQDLEDVYLKLENYIKILRKELELRLGEFE